MIYNSRATMIYNHVLSIKQPRLLSQEKNEIFLCLKKHLKKHHFLFNYLQTIKKIGYMLNIALNDKQIHNLFHDFTKLMKLEKIHFSSLIKYQNRNGKICNIFQRNSQNTIYILPKDFYLFKNHNFMKFKYYGFNKRNSQKCFFSMLKKIKETIIYTREYITPFLKFFTHDEVENFLAKKDGFTALFEYVENFFNKIKKSKIKTKCIYKNKDSFSSSKSKLFLEMNKKIEQISFVKKRNTNFFINLRKNIKFL